MILLNDLTACLSLSMVLGNMQINCKASLLERGLKGTLYNSRLTNRHRRRANQKGLCLASMAYRRSNSSASTIRLYLATSFPTMAITAHELSRAQRVFCGLFCFSTFKARYPRESSDLHTHPSLTAPHQRDT